MLARDGTSASSISCTCLCILHLSFFCSRVVRTFLSRLEIGAGLPLLGLLTTVQAVQKHALQFVKSIHLR